MGQGESLMLSYARKSVSLCISHVESRVVKQVLEACCPIHLIPYNTQVRAGTGTYEALHSGGEYPPGLRSKCWLVHLSRGSAGGAAFGGVCLQYDGEVAQRVGCRKIQPVSHAPGFSAFK